MQTLKQLKKIKAQKSNLDKVPSSPGIYVFWSESGAVNYIGKAINLKKRLTSYFSKTIEGKTRNMVRASEYISYIKVGSELEALVLEANLVGTYKPKYNSDLKDDKKPLYIKITDEFFPRVQTARKIEKGQNKAFFGPFPSGYKVRSVLRMLRRVFPFSDHKMGKDKCFYSHLGLCSPCPSVINSLSNKNQKEFERKKYLKNIKNLKSILSGNINGVKKNLIKEMEEFSKQEKYESAQEIKRQLELLSYITQPITSVSGFLKNPNLIEDIRENEIADLTKMVRKYIKAPKSLIRIECFDVAHMQGTSPTASMVTFINAEPEKSMYRRFKINQNKGNSDTDSLREVAKRRLKYLATWGVPDLIIVDGGKGQVSAFLDMYEKEGIAVCGLAKREETLVFGMRENGKIRFVERVVPKGPARNLVVRLRNEAHRFARSYHFKLVEKNLFEIK